MIFCVNDDESNIADMWVKFKNLIGFRRTDNAAVERFTLHTLEGREILGEAD